MEKIKGQYMTVFKEEKESSRRYYVSISKKFDEKYESATIGATLSKEMQSFVDAHAEPSKTEGTSFVRLHVTDFWLTVRRGRDSYPNVPEVFINKAELK